MAQVQAPEHILAAYVVYKNFYDHDAKSNSRDILARFIKYILTEKRVRAFTLINMEEWIRDEFGFRIPEAVVKSAINSLKKAGLLTLDEGQYRLAVDPAECMDASDEEKIQKETNAAKGILDLLEKHLARDGWNKKYDRLEIFEELNRFLMDEEPRHADLGIQISSFVLALEERDPNWYRQIASMRVGCILFNGISYNLDQVKIRDGKLKLFLATEILFDIAGLNGEVWKHVAEDFLDLVKSFNRDERHIILLYFASTRKEVDAYFGSAEMSVKTGTSGVVFKTAMRNILSGCSTPSEVQEKEVRFFNDLKRLGIEEDTTDYYADGLEIYNWESVESEQEDRKHLEYLSNVNKLRRGRRSKDYIASGALLLTEASRALKLSDMNNSDKVMAPLAVRIGSFTRYLWHRLSKGYGTKMNPQWFDASVKAKIILSEVINHNINTIYEKTKKAYQEGRIDQEEIKETIISLRSYDISPDNLTEERAEAGLELTEETIVRSLEERQLTDRKLRRASEELATEKMAREKMEAQIKALRAEKKQAEEEQKQQQLRDQNRRKTVKVLLVVGGCIAASIAGSALLESQQNMLNLFLALIGLVASAKILW